VAGEQAAILVFVEAQGGKAGHVLYFSAMALPWLGTGLGDGLGMA
jgi:hypothetical protein